MIILRQNNYSFGERLKKIENGALMGAISSLVFAIPVGLISKLSGGIFKKGAGYTALCGAILGALIGNSVYSSDKARKEFDNWKEKNQKALEDLVKKNLPSKMNQLKEFSDKVKKLNVNFIYYDLVYDVFTGRTIEDLVNILASILYREYKNKPLPESYPIPILEISTAADMNYNIWLLWYDKKEGWVHKGKKISGPKEFILDCIENKFDYYDHIEENSDFQTYKKKFINLVNKYLW